MALTPNQPMVSGHLFQDTFIFRGEGGEAGPRREFTDNWIPSNFTVSSEISLETSVADELVYSGTPLNGLRRINGSANYSLTVLLRAQAGLSFEIQGRRSDTSNHIAVGVDFSANNVYIRGETTSLVLSTINASHTFVDNNLYVIELSMFNDDLRAYVNAAEIIKTDWDQNLTNHGTSINVLTVPTEPASFIQFTVFENETQAQPAPNPDLSDLFLLYRILAKVEIEAQTNDWRSFVDARTAWNRHRNLGLMNKTWEALGYSWLEPTPEAWFG